MNPRIGRALGFFGTGWTAGSHESNRICSMMEVVSSPLGEIYVGYRSEGSGGVHYGEAEYGLTVYFDVEDSGPL